MTKEEKIEILEKEKAYMMAHGGDRQAEALTSAIKALSTLDKVIAYCKQSPSVILPEDVLSLIRGEDVEIETDYGYEKFEPQESEEQE